MFISCSKENESEIREIIQTVFDKNNIDAYIDSYISEDSCRISIEEIGWFSLYEEIEEVCTILQEMLSDIVERFPNVQVGGEVSIGDKNYRKFCSVETSSEGITVLIEETLNGIPEWECWFPYILNGDYGPYLAGFTTKEECGTFFKLFKEYMKDYLEEKEISFETFINSDLLEEYFRENRGAYGELCDLCEEEGFESPYTPWMGEFKDFCVSAWDKYQSELKADKVNQQ